MKRYRIKLDGFDEFEIEARNAGAAKYAVWRNAEEAGYFAERGGFKRFLHRVYVQRIGARLLANALA